MQVPKIFLRIAKILGKTILGLLLIFFLVLALIHLPPVQKQITRKLSTYLSSKIEAKVDIQRISFSMLGNLAIDDVTVWDTNNTQIFSVRKVEVASSIYNLITGDFIFDQVSISGATFKLTEDQEGFNIQFILDAFKPNEKKVSIQSNSILQFKKVHLENVRFEFISTLSGISVDVDLGSLKSEQAEFSTNPVSIKADQLTIQQTQVNTLSIGQSDVPRDSVRNVNSTLLSPDFGTGIVFAIRELVLKDDNISFHKDQITETSKFDPNHLTLKNIQLQLAELSMNQDTLSAGLQSLSVQLPGFNLTNGSTGLFLNNNQIVFSNLHLASGNNELQADIHTPNNFSSTNHANGPIEVTAQGQFNPADLGYFFSDAVINQYRHWGSTELAVTGAYHLDQGEIKTLTIKTNNSLLHAKGKVYDALDMKKINWKDVVVNATIGSDFKNVFMPFLSTIHVPPHATLQLKSAGNMENMNMDATILTSWGDVKANGQIIRQASSLHVDMNLTGEKVDPGKWFNLAWVGPMNLSAHAIGMIGDNQNLAVKGLINEIELLDQPIHNIAFESLTRKDNATVNVSVSDPIYRSEVSSEISFEGPLIFTNSIQLDSFNLGRLIQRDSTLLISGDTKSKLIIDSTSMEGYVAGTQMLFQKHSMKYALDTLAIHTLLSPTASAFEYYTDYAKANLVSNFDIREADEIIQRWSGTMLGESGTIPPARSRTATVNIEIENAGFIKLFGIDVDEFAALRVAGEFEEQKELATLAINSGKFTGYGISLDSLTSHLMIFRDSAHTSLHASNFLYNSIKVGDLDLDLMKKGDSTLSNLQVSNDTITLLGWRAHILHSDSGTFIYTNTLSAFDNEFSIDPENSIQVEKNNLVLNHFQINRDSMQLSLDGDLNAFDVSFKHINLTPLNYIISPDTTLIDKGYLTGKVSYSRDQLLNLTAAVDSFRLYNSEPLTIATTAVSDGNEVPFQLLVTNASNSIDLKGKYLSDNNEVDASLLLDVNNLELFQFLVTGFIDEMKGEIHGEATIRGSIQKPALKGHLQFLDVGLTTVNPKLTFNVENDRIALNDSTLLFDHFTLYDLERHPLTIDGSISLQDQSFAYDLQLNSDQFNLINHPDSTRGKLRGLLVIDSNVKVKGNGKDTHVEANIKIKDDTDLTFANSSDDIALLKAEGIVDFIDPALLADSTALAQSTNFYDSLVASLPDFNLNSTITIEDNATLRVLIDEQSGDYIEAAGAATLELSYDRSGNLNLAGEYTIKNGAYRLSFYDLVKKNFNLVPGSSITWSGNPESGDLNIKAVHTVESNSIGLIGHEISENEKSIYKRSLNYEVGINISGTIENPIVSFSLDLPQNEKVNYPVLANKLDRMRQPEYASELNKQVFGLLVLGGFLPESSADVNSSVIATTALSNSVNSLLASQLNRFASQYIKGVNIDVGIQSFSDYSAPGGKTQTAMDFRVSKSIMNDRLSFEIGGDFDLNQDQSGGNTGKNYRGDVAIIYDLTGNGDKQLKLFNNETYDIVYQEIRNTGISLIFIREFDNKKKAQAKNTDQ